MRPECGLQTLSNTAVTSATLSRSSLWCGCAPATSTPTWTWTTAETSSASPTPSPCRSCATTCSGTALYCTALHCTVLYCTQRAQVHVGEPQAVQRHPGVHRDGGRAARQPPLLKLPGNMLTSLSVTCRASNDGSRRFHNHRGGLFAN